MNLKNHLAQAPLFVNEENRNQKKSGWVSYETKRKRVRIGTYAPHT
jgi:hypothetical protein